MAVTMIGDPLPRIIADVERRLHNVEGMMAAEMEAVVKENIRNGRNTGRYSTRPGWYNVSRPWGARGRFQSFIRQNRDNRASKFGRSSVFLPQGYAQFRAIYRGESVRRAPVTFELTGEMMRNLVGRARARRGGVEIWLAFKRQQRSYGRLTNIQLAEKLAERGGANNPFAPNKREREKIIKNALRAARLA